MQGNPGEGKTTLALRLAAACTTGGTLPGMKPLPPFQVIYQTAEDGLGDTVKPRLIEAAADLDRVLVIDAVSYTHLKVLNKLYEDNALGTIPQDRYEQMSQKYSEEYYALKAELATLQELSLIHISFLFYLRSS